MGWFLTYTGKRIDPESPRVEDINATDIAHSLSNVCRFGGHVTRFYSVAQHSCMVSAAAPHRLKKWGLLHDATEAYLGDVILPIKTVLADYKALERAWSEAVKRRFMMEVSEGDEAEVKILDKRALMSERNSLFCGRYTDWSIDKEGIAPLVSIVTPWTPRKSEAEFRWLCQLYEIR
jgi:hypothetical protein